MEKMPSTSQGFQKLERESLSLFLKEMNSWKTLMCCFRPKNCEITHFCWRQPFLCTCSRPLIGSAYFFLALVWFHDLQSCLNAQRSWSGFGSLKEEGGSFRPSTLKYNPLVPNNPSSQHPTLTLVQLPRKREPRIRWREIGQYKNTYVTFIELLPICLHLLSRIATQGH